MFDVFGRLTEAHAAEWCRWLIHTKDSVDEVPDMPDELDGESQRGLEPDVQMSAPMSTMEEYGEYVDESYAYAYADFCQC